MRREITVNFGHPANVGVLDYLKQSQASFDLLARPPSLSPEQVEDPYVRLGTHPELVARLWDQVAASLPEPCSWVVYGTPVLVSPASGIIFAFAGGTQTYALRLPEEEYREAVAVGAERVRHYPAYPYLNVQATTLDLSRFGDGWVFGGYRTRGNEGQWCLAAYRHAQGTRG